MGLESGMGGLEEAVGAPRAGSGGDAGGFGVRWGLWSPPGWKQKLCRWVWGAGRG